MFKINENYHKLPGSYLFSTIAKKVSAFTEAHPDKELIRLGIGDVTQPLAPAVIAAMHKAVDEMGDAGTFRGMPRIWGMPSSGTQSRNMITNYAGAIFPRTKSLCQTVQKAILPIFRRFLGRKTGLPSATRFTPYM